MRKKDFDEQVDALSSLHEPVRRALYQHVAGQTTEVSREQAARAVGISRILAAFHLDRLVEAGLLEPMYRRLSGRTGPGAGRPSKLYRRANRQFALLLPERHYDVLARLFAEALESQQAAPGRNQLRAAARKLGKGLGNQAANRARGKTGERRRLGEGLRLLRDYGFEPSRQGEWIILRNCPFDALARDHRDLVCGANFALMEGFVDGLRARGLQARLAPEDGRCCVLLAAAPSS